MFIGVLPTCENVSSPVTELQRVESCYVGAWEQNLKSLEVQGVLLAANPFLQSCIDSC